MSCDIKFHKNALKSLQKLDKKARNRILDNIHLLAEHPKNKQLNIKKMEGTANHFRLRVGSYRVLYSIYLDERMIVIVRIGSRGDIYKKP